MPSFQQLSEATHQLTAFIRDALIPLCRELIFLAAVAGALVGAWRRVFTRKRRPPAKAPPEG
jgi:hypothetical protein